MYATLLGLCCLSPILDPVRISTALGMRLSKRDLNCELPDVDFLLGSISVIYRLEEIFFSEVRSFLTYF